MRPFNHRTLRIVLISLITFISFRVNAQEKILELPLSASGDTSIPTIHISETSTSPLLKIQINSSESGNHETINVGIEELINKQDSSTPATLQRSQENLIPSEFTDMVTPDDLVAITIKSTHYSKIFLRKRRIFLYETDLKDSSKTETDIININENIKHIGHFTCNAEFFFLGYKPKTDTLLLIRKQPSKKAEFILFDVSTRPIARIFEILKLNTLSDLLKKTSFVAQKNGIWQTPLVTDFKDRIFVSKNRIYLTFKLGFIIAIDLNKLQASVLKLPTSIYFDEDRKNMTVIEDMLVTASAYEHKLEVNFYDLNTLATISSFSFDITDSTVYNSPIYRYDLDEPNTQWSIEQSFKFFEMASRRGIAISAKRDQQKNLILSIGTSFQKVSMKSLIASSLLFGAGVAFVSIADNTLGYYAMIIALGLRSNSIGYFNILFNKNCTRQLAEKLKRNPYWDLVRFLRQNEPYTKQSMIGFIDQYIYVCFTKNNTLLIHRFADY